MIDMMKLLNLLTLSEPMVQQCQEVVVDNLTRW
jgi:hypothetical protein